MIVIDKNTKKILIETLKTKNIGLEGNITKLIDAEDDQEFKEYLKTCIDKDISSRRKRLEMTKQVQVQNKDLTELNEENQRILEELQETLKNVEESKMTFEVQNRELNEWKLENIRLTDELQNEMLKSEQARITAENAKNEAENNLDLIQKKTQFELINNIVRVALYVIIGVGCITTGIYVYSMTIGMDTDIIGSTWSNMFGILLTNSFSIVGTILGVKYGASPNKDK
jgi:predicted RNase H-like nuclease (RuvC/YqgF family)